MAKYYKIVVYVPLEEALKIRELLGKVGAGHIGNYDYTSFSVKGTGRFRPLAGAKPSIGKVGKIEEVPEERIETVVEEEILDEVIFQIRKNHPYEEPVIDIYLLISPPC
jgi:hypothetical protein